MTPLAAEPAARGASGANLRGSVERAVAALATSRWLPAALLVVFAASATSSLVREGPTFDETAHLSAGYTYLTQFDFRLTPEHPPLAKVLSAMPLVLAGARMPDAPGHDGWQRGDAWAFGYDFFYRTRGNDANTLLTLGRLPIVGLGVLLGVLVYVFAREVSGETGGRMALFCLAFCPTVLAHTRLATTDVAVTLFYLATVHATYRLGQHLSLATGAYLGVALGLALASKFSALLLLVVTGALLVWRALDRSPLASSVGHRERVLSGSAQKGVALAGMFVIVLGVALCIVWGVYGFRFEAYAEPGRHLDASVAAHLTTFLRQHPWLGAALDMARAHRLLPESYLDGFTYLAARSGGRAAYLLGERSMSGFPFFFPIAFAVKTPLPVVLLALPAVASLLLGGPERSWTRRCLGVGALTYLGVSLAASLNIGQRHLLPLYPFLFIAIGSLAPWIDGRQARQWLRYALLATWYVAAWVSITPHYLAYFNELALGPAHGDRILADSNLDWGQDVKALGQWVRHRGITTLPYAHFGTSRPQYHGIDPFISLPGASTVPPEDRAEEWTLADLAAGRAEFVAIHVTNLRGVYLPDTMTVAGRRHAVGKDYYQQFVDQEPVARIGYSINVYRNPWYRTPGREGAGQ